MNFDDLMKASEKHKSSMPKPTAHDLELMKEASKTSTGLAETLFSANPSMGYSFKPNEDYKEYGLTQNPFDTPYSLNNKLIEKQGALKKVGNSLVRIVGDTLLDMGAGVADIATLPIDIYDALTGKYNSDYSNPVSKFLSEQRDKLDEEFKIYRDTNKHLDSGALLDYAWYLDNAPSLFSSLSLLFPAKAATVLATKAGAGLIKLGKNVKEGIALSKAENALGAENRLSRVIAGAERLDEEKKALSLGDKARGFWYANKGPLAGAADVVSNALLSRTIENYQEARNLHKTVYNRAIDELDAMRNDTSDPERYNKYIEENGFQGMSDDEIAKYIAGKAADEDFKDNIANVTFDIIQFAGLRSMWKGTRGIGASNYLKKINEKTKSMMGAVEQAAAAKGTAGVLSTTGNAIKTATKTVGKHLWQNKGFIAAEGTEGIEEIVNYISEQEGIHVGNLLLNKDDGKSRHTKNRILDYFEDGELWDNAFWGFMGGLLFGSVGDRAMNYIDHRSFHSIREEQLKRLMEARPAKFNQMMTKLEQINRGYSFKNGNPVANTYTTVAQKEEFKNQIINDAINEIALDEVRLGNGDLLRDFVSSEELKKALVNKQVVKENEADDFIQGLSKSIDKMNDMYNSEITNVTAKVRNINAKFGEIIVPEFIEKLAYDNVKNRLQKESIETNILKLDNELKKEAPDEVTDPILKQMTDALTASSEIHLLNQQKEQIKKNKKLGDDILIAQIDDQIEQIKKDFALTATPVFNAFMNATSSIWETSNGLLRINSDKLGAITHEDFKKIDDKIAQEDFDAFKQDFQVPYGKIVKDIESLSPNEVGATIDKIKSNKNKKKILEEQSLLRAGLSNLDAAYNNTHSKIINNLKHLNLTLSEAFNKVLNNASEQLLKYTRKYNQKKPGTVQKVLQDYLDKGTKEGLDKQGISEEDLDNMISILNAVKVKSAIESRDQRFGIEQTLGNLLNDMEILDRFEQERKAQAEKDKQVVNVGKNKKELKNQNNNNNTTENNNDNQSNIEQEEKKSPQQKALEEAIKNKQEQDSLRNEKLEKAGISKTEQAYNENETNDSVSFYKDMKVNDDSENATDAINKGNDIYILKADTPEYFSNDQLYAENPELNFMDEIEVVSHPVVEIKDGKITVLKQGWLQNTDKSKEERAEIERLRNHPVEENTGGNNPDAGNTEDNSVPGENEDNKRLEEEAKRVGQALAESENHLESVDINLPMHETVFQNPVQLRGVFIAELAKKENIDRINNESDISNKIKIIDEIKEICRKAFVTSDKNMSQEEFDRIISASEYVVKRAIIKNRDYATSIENEKLEVQEILDKMLKVPGKGVVNSAISALQNKTAYLSIVDPQHIFENLEEDIDKLLSNYCKRKQFAHINGIYYLSLSPLFNEVNELPLELYPYIAKFIESHSDKYVIAEDIYNPDDILYPVDVPADTNNESIRLDIWDVISKFNNKDLADYWKTFDSLKLGDEVVLELDAKDDNIIVIKTQSGVKLGYLRTPTLKGDSYRTVNNGLIWQIRKGETTFHGEIFDLFNNIFNLNVTNEEIEGIEELRANIYELSFKHKDWNTDKAKELIKAIGNSKAIPEHLKATTNGKINELEIAKGFSHVLKYLQVRQGFDSDFNSIQKQLISYFYKIYNNLDETYNIRKNILDGTKTNPTYKISNITEGKVVRNSTNQQSTKEKLKQHTPVLSSVANLNTDINNPNAHRIAIDLGNGEYSIAGVGNVSEQTNPKTTKAGVTYLTLPIRGASRNYVSASCPKFSKVKNDKFKKDIINPIIEYFEDLLKHNEFDKIKDLLLNDLSRDKNRISLFQGITAKLLQTGSIGIYTTIDGVNYSMIINEQFGEDNKAKINIKKDGAEKGEFLSYYEFVKKGYAKKLINNLGICLDYTLIEGDTKTDVSKDSLFTGRKPTGEFVVKIPKYNGNTTSYTYPSFNDFVISNNLINVDTSIDSTTGSNVRRSNDNDMVRSTIEIQTQDRYVKSNLEGNAAAFTRLRSEIERICNSNSENKAIDIIEKIIEYMPRYDTKFKEDLQPLIDLIKDNEKDFFLLPKIIKFVGNDKRFKKLNTFGENEKIWASRVVDTGEVRIGNNWLSMLDYRNINNTEDNPTNWNPRFAITTLIHEELHGKFKLPQNTKYVKQCEGIYNEFIAAVNNLNEGELKNILLDEIKTINGDVEEFIIRSLTDANLMAFLNETDAVHDNAEVKEENKSIFNKLLDVLFKIFDIIGGARKGSLLYKEYLALADLVTTIDNTSKIELIKQDAKNITLDSEGYTRDKKLHARTTTVIEATDNLSKTEEDKNHLAKYSIVATSIGTGFDEFTRDFFANLEEFNKLSEEELGKLYPNARPNSNDEEDLSEPLTEFREDLQKLKQYFDDNNITIIPYDVKLTGVINLVDKAEKTHKLRVGGTVDLLGIDKDGNYHLYDMKTIHADDINTAISNNSAKWQAQLSLYSEMLRQQYGINVVSSEIIPIKVKYPDPVKTKTEYRLLDESKKDDYSNPYRNQLVYKKEGDTEFEEFTEAAPRLDTKINPDTGNTEINLISFKESPVSISYEQAKSLFGKDLNKYLETPVTDDVEIDNDDDSKSDEDAENDNENYLDGKDNEDEDDEDENEDDEEPNEDDEDYSVASNFHYVRRLNNPKTVNAFLGMYRPEIAKKLGELLYNGDISLRC